MGRGEPVCARFHSAQKNHSIPAASRCRHKNNGWHLLLRSTAEDPLPLGSDMPPTLWTQQRGAVLVEYLVVVIVTLVIADIMGPPLGKLAVEQYTARRAVLYSMYP